jgi:hypothetical protein
MKNGFRAGVLACGFAMAFAAVVLAQEAGAGRPADEAPLPKAQATRAAKTPAWDNSAMIERALAAQAPGSLMQAVESLPKGKELLALYRAEAGAAETSLQTLRQNFHEEIMEAARGGADEAKLNEIFDRARAELLFASVKVTEARIRYAEQLLNLAKEDPKAVSAQEVENTINMLNSAREFQPRRGIPRTTPRPVEP